MCQCLWAALRCPCWVWRVTFCSTFLIMYCCGYSRIVYVISECVSVCGKPFNICVRCVFITVGYHHSHSVSEVNVSLWPPISCLCQMWMCRCDHPSHVHVGYECVTTTLLISVSDVNVSLWPPFSCLLDMNVSLWLPFSCLCQMWMCHCDHPSHVC